MLFCLLFFKKAERRIFLAEQKRSSRNGSPKKKPGNKKSGGETKSRRIKIESQVEVRPEYSWDRQVGESADAYQRFIVYRDMPYSRMEDGRLFLDPTIRRNISEVARQFGLSRDTIIRDIFDKSWKKRCEEYDIFIQNRNNREEERDRKKAIIRTQRITRALLHKAMVEWFPRLNPNKVGVRDFLEVVKFAMLMESQALGIDYYRKKQFDQEDESARSKNAAGLLADFVKVLSESAGENGAETHPEGDSSPVMLLEALGEKEEETHAEGGENGAGG